MVLTSGGVVESSPVGAVGDMTGVSVSCSGVKSFDLLPLSLSVRLYSAFRGLSSSEVAIVCFGVRYDMVHDCTQVYGREHRIHVSGQTAFSSSKLWSWATMVELEPVAHWRLQFAALHMPSSWVEQKDTVARGGGGVTATPADRRDTMYRYSTW
jgi:hypothetical protein